MAATLTSESARDVITAAYPRVLQRQQTPIDHSAAEDPEPSPLRHRSNDETTANGKPLPLDAAIRQLIELGHKDPLEIARALERTHEPGWIAGQLAMLAEDLVTELARKQLGQRRRGFELALKPGMPITHANMKLAGFWIPDWEGVPTWKAADEVTPEDLDRRATWYESFAIGVLRRAQWCRQVAALMRQEGAPVLAQLRVELPPLPEPEPIL